MSQPKIQLRRATSADIEHIGRVIWPLAQANTPHDAFVHEHRARHWKHYARSCCLCAKYEFYSNNYVFIVAEATGAPDGQDSASKYGNETPRVIGAAIWEWISTSEPKCVPATVQLPPRSLSRRLKYMYYRSIFEIHHEYLDRSQNRKNMLAFRDEEQCPTVPFGNFKEEDAPQTWLLSEVGVLPEWQGHGVGRMLVEWGIGRAKEGVKGGAGAESEVHIDCQANPGTQAFYEKLGFEKYSKWEMGELEWNEMIWRSGGKPATRDDAGVVS